MKTRHDEHRVINDQEEQGVGESAQQRAPYVGKDNRKLQRIGDQPLDGMVEFRAKGSAQTAGLRFVPVLRFACFDLCCG